jgi:hypothetical protein
MHPALHVAIQEARECEEEARLLRLFVQNLPRYPTSAALRLLFYQLLAHRIDTDTASRLLPVVFQTALHTGDALCAIASIRLLEPLQPSSAAQQLDELFRALAERPMAHTHLDDDPPPPDLLAERPELPLEGLIAVAVELAAHPPDRLPTTPFQPIPLLSQLSPETLRWLLLRLAPFELVDGEPIVASDLPFSGWLVWGQVTQADTTVRHRHPALLLPREAPLLSAAGAGLLVAPRRGTEAEIAAHPELRAALAELAARRTLLEHLHTGSSSPLFREHPSLLSVLRLVGLARDEVIPGAENAYVWLLLGSVVEPSRGASASRPQGTWLRLSRTDALRATLDSVVVLIPRTALPRIPPPALDGLDRRAETVLSTTEDSASIELADDDLVHEQRGDVAP